MCIRLAKHVGQVDSEKVVVQVRKKKVMPERLVYSVSIGDRTRAQKVRAVGVNHYTTWSHNASYSEKSTICTSNVISRLPLKCRGQTSSGMAYVGLRGPVFDMNIQRIHFVYAVG